MLASGDRIGGYQVTSVVTGQRAAYRAIRVADDRRALIRIGSTDTWPSSAIGILRAAQSLAGLDHPGIARVLDRGALRGGRAWFAAELLDGPSLASEPEIELAASDVVVIPSPPMLRAPRWTPAPTLASELVAAQLELLAATLRRS